MFVVDVAVWSDSLFNFFWDLKALVSHSLFNKRSKSMLEDVQGVMLHIHPFEEPGSWKGNSIQTCVVSLSFSCLCLVALTQWAGLLALKIWWCLVQVAIVGQLLWILKQWFICAAATRSKQNFDSLCNVPNKNETWDVFGCWSGSLVKVNNKRDQLWQIRH